MSLSEEERAEPLQDLALMEKYKLQVQHLQQILQETVPCAGLRLFGQAQVKVCPNAA